MNSILSSIFPQQLFAVAYTSNDEYIYDLVKKVEMVAAYYIYATNPSAKQIDRLRGLVVNIDTVKSVLGANPEFKSSAGMVYADIEKCNFFINSRINSDEFMALDYIRNLYSLSDLEMFCISLGLMPHIDKKYERLFTYLQDDAFISSIEYNLVLKLYYFVDDIQEIPGFYEKISSLREKMEFVCSGPGDFVIDEKFVSFVLSNGMRDISSRVGHLYLHLGDDVVQCAPNEAICNYILSGGGYVYIHGVAGIGKRTEVKSISKKLGKPILFIDFLELDLGMTYNEIEMFIVPYFRECTLNGAYLCIYNAKYDNDNKSKINFIFDVARRFSAVIFVLSEEKRASYNIISDSWLDIELKYPDKAQSLALWQDYLGKNLLNDSINLEEITHKFTFTPLQIKCAAEVIRNNSVAFGESLDMGALNRAAYLQIDHRLTDVATVVAAKYNWDDIILAPEQKGMLRNACNQVRYKNLVYDSWNFARRITYGRGVSILLAGPPGTGKTMASQVVANDLNMELYKVDLSQIVSKYIGETEKNLNNLFKEARKSNVILLFDETDALFGKRTEVKDSHDKNANLETSFLLQKMEEYDGVTFMTTNYLENIDNAFFRRISYVIHFAFPDEKHREEIWRAIFPREMPLGSDIDFKYLARQFELAGGNIKNIAVVAAFLSAQSTRKLEMLHIITAIKYELAKQGKVMIKQDFGEYSYLLDV